MAPTRFHDGPNVAPVGPMLSNSELDMAMTLVVGMAQYGPINMAQGGPTMVHDGPNMAPRRPRAGPCWPKMAPRGAT